VSKQKIFGAELPPEVKAQENAWRAELDAKKT